LIDINTATAAELAGLPLIGPAKAAAIIAYRDAHGPFREINDITAVPGIGPATLARLRANITASAPHETPARPDAAGSDEK
jgi:competence protein ComEA